MVPRTDGLDIIHFSMDYKAIQEKLREDNKFLSEILRILPNVKSCVDASEEGSQHVPSHIKCHEKRLGGRDDTVRAKSFEELHARLEELKGKKLNYKDKLIKKKLKNQMKKKKRSKDTNMKCIINKLPKSEKEEILGVAKGAIANKSSKPVFNSAGKMVFSKFDFKSDSVVEEGRGVGRKDAKRKKGLVLKEKGEGWAAVLARSRGEKVLDDPELLKKSKNRAEAKKRSSQRKWKEREEKVMKEKGERQAKRSAAIAGKKKERKVKKLKKAVKKGRIIPGFS